MIRPRSPSTSRRGQRESPVSAVRSGSPAGKWWAWTSTVTVIGVALASARPGIWGQYLASAPPSTVRLVPVIMAASSDTRNTSGAT